MCVLFITLYGFHLWYFKEALLYQPLKKLKKIQKRVALQIIKVFYISLLQELRLQLALSLSIFILIKSLVDIISEQCFYLNNIQLILSQINIILKKPSLIIQPQYYNLRTLERSNSCIKEDTRELNRELFTKQSTLYTYTDGLY